MKSRFLKMNVFHIFVRCSHPMERAILAKELVYGAFPRLFSCSKMDDTWHIIKLFYRVFLYSYGYLYSVQHFRFKNLLVGVYGGLEN